MNKITQESIDRWVARTFPPDVKDWPEDMVCTFDGDGGDTTPNHLFAEELRFALKLVYTDSDTRLLDALRRRWPEAVRDGWPDASEAALRLIKRQGDELSAEGVAALVAMPADEPTPLPLERKPSRVARVPAMA